MKRIAIFFIALFSFASVATSETVWNNIAEEISAYEINCVVLDTDNQHIIYVGTDNGLFLTDSAGESWKRINIGWGAKKIINAIFVRSGHIYLATQGGLYISDDGGTRWSRSHGIAGKRPILSAAVDSSAIYITSSEGLLRSLDGGRSWETIKAGYPDDRTIEDFMDDRKIESFSINCIALSSKYPGRLYIGTNDGIYFKERDSSVFKRFIDEGLTDKKILYITESRSEPYTLYAIAKNRVYYFDESWNQFALPRYLGRPRSIDFNTKNDRPALVATDRGLFRKEVLESACEISRLETTAICNYFKTEPSIHEVQEEAIEYAEVHPYKIASWRRRANISAVLPRLSFGIDRSSSDGIHWDAGQNPDIWVTGPENENTGWDITFTWDLSELIWNGDQTLIDVRSKLMVQLRDDILDEVTSYYYERRRLQIDLLEAPPNDTRSRLKKELRVQELAANIDALTGGYFSHQLRPK